MENLDELSLDKKMVLTLDLVRNTLYSTGLCGKLFTYRKHAEKLLASNPDTENKTAFDLLDAFRDFMNRYEKGRLKKSEEVYFLQQLVNYR